MLFITNRRIEGSRRSQPGRQVVFAAGDSEPGASLFFCQRQGPEQYVELTALPFFARLRRSVRRQVLFYVHGFNCQPEARIFPDAERLQNLCDTLAPDLVEVVPLIWPCDDDFGLVLDYWDDQQGATASGGGRCRRGARGRGALVLGLPVLLFAAWQRLPQRAKRREGRGLSLASGVAIRHPRPLMEVRMVSSHKLARRSRSLSTIARCIRSRPSAVCSSSACT